MKVTSEEDALNSNVGVNKRKLQENEEILIQENVSKKRKVEPISIDDNILDLDEAIDQHKIESKVKDLKHTIHCNNQDGLCSKKLKIESKDKEPAKKHPSDPVKSKKAKATVAVASESDKCLTNVVIKDLDDSKVIISESVDDSKEFCNVDDLSEKIIAEALSLDNYSEIITLHDPLHITGDDNEMFDNNEIKKSPNTDEGFEFVHENNEYVTYNEIVNNSTSYDGDVVKEIDRVNNNSNDNSNSNLNRQNDDFYQNSIDDDSPILRSLMIKSLNKNEEQYESAKTTNYQNKIKVVAKNSTIQDNSNLIIRDRGTVKLDNNNDKNTFNENNQLPNYPISWPRGKHNTNDKTKTVELNQSDVDNVKDTAPTDVGKCRSSKKSDKVKHGKNS